MLGIDTDAVRREPIAKSLLNRMKPGFTGAKTVTLELVELSMVTKSNLLFAKGPVMKEVTREMSG